MVINEKACPNCGGGLMHYDTVSRKCVMKDRNVSVVEIRRMRCKKCKKLHREIPPYIFPFKHYETEIVLGVVEGLITSDTLGYEDYPCEVTMKRWVDTIDKEFATNYFTHLCCFNKAQ